MNLLSITCLLILMALNYGQTQPVGVMTYNIRYDNPNDGENRWSMRKAFLAKQLKFYEPEIFGIQEGLKHQVDYLDSCLTAYQYVGVGRDDGEKKGEYTALFYDTSRFDLHKSGTFWLSKTPERPSVGWDAALERICTYILLQDKRDKQSFWVFNTHFDHIGELARENSAKLILEKMKLLNTQDYPVVLMGDLNLEPDHHSIRYLSNQMIDTQRADLGITFGPEGTFNGFNWNKTVKRRIDYIFISRGRIEVKKYGVLTDSVDKRYPSDHFPVFVELSINK